MPGRFERWLPTPAQVAGNRWLRWMGPALHHPRLWHVSRRGVALGVAIGIFFGFLIPIAQIPVSAAAAVLLRANVPTAVASTLVTNPITFPPIYYAAWKVGGALLGEDPSKPPPPLPGTTDHGAGRGAPDVAPAVAGDEGWWAGALRHIGSVGRPLLLGLALFAVVGGLSVYGIIHLAWVVQVRLKRRRRLRDGIAAGR
jgi:uncharacterized protein